LTFDLFNLLIYRNIFQPLEEFIDLGFQQADVVLEFAGDPAIDSGVFRLTLDNRILVYLIAPPWI
jgi:hypothetical protein